MLARVLLVAAMLLTTAVQAATTHTNATTKKAGGGAGGNVPLDLVLLSDAQGVAKGAVCLDGTNPGFYYAKGSGSGANTWVLYFKGGGWCYNEASCAKRTHGALGSSKHFAPTFAFSGIMDSQASVNPTFYNANRVILWYCDGASFSGNADAVNNVTGTPLHFRGRRVLDALLDTLLDARGPYGLGDAREVLLAGGSAGGLAAFLHADYVASRMPKGVAKFKVSPVSGFFLLHDDDASPPVPLYPDEMQYVFRMQNSTGGVNARCVESINAEDDQWRCIFANYSYAHTQSPIFPMNSAIDAWQMGNIWKGDASCAQQNFAKCTPGQVADLNGYMADFLRDLARSATASRPGNGAFIESCLEHCGEQSARNFEGYKLRGVTMQEAHTKWWASDGTDPAATHTYLPGCTLHAAAPHQCNPSCSKRRGNEHA